MRHDSKLKSTSMRHSAAYPMGVELLNVGRVLA